MLLLPYTLNETIDFIVFDSFDLVNLTINTSSTLRAVIYSEKKYGIVKSVCKTTVNT